MKYYSKAIQFYLRGFVDSLINKYIEYLKDGELSNSQQDEIETSRLVFQKFQKWLWDVTNN